MRMKKWFLGYERGGKDTRFFLHYEETHQYHSERFTYIPITLTEENERALLAAHAFDDGESGHTWQVHNDMIEDDCIQTGDAVEVIKQLTESFLLLYPT
jgi:hypothetical protein